MSAGNVGCGLVRPAASKLRGGSPPRPEPRFEKGSPMPVIYRFSSSVTTGLFAFAGDAEGSMLPEKHGPWETKGGIRPGEPIPHRLDRETVERAIDDHGFQLWRMKKHPEQA